MAIETAVEFAARKDREWRTGVHPVELSDGWAWTREAWLLHPQHNHPTKVISVERLRCVGVPVGATSGARVGDIEYRWAYWLVTAAGHWDFVQHPPMIPAQDLIEMLRWVNGEAKDLAVQFRRARP